MNLFLTRLGKKYSPKTIQRPDVILKTLFRLVRSFYAVKLDELTKFKTRKRHGKPKESFIFQVDQLVNEMFGSDLSEQGTSLIKLSESLAALIYPKSLS